jgi:hypothetical protein
MVEKDCRQRIVSLQYCEPLSICVKLTRVGQKLRHSSSNSKTARASLREAFMKIAKFIELNPQYPYIPLVIVVRLMINQRLIFNMGSHGRRWSCSPNGSP